MPELTKLGKYEIKRELGKGAMGIVYEGFDPFIERTVAIKTILKSMLESSEAQEMLDRFRREAQAAGRLTHPNIVSIYEYGEDQDVAFIAMEFIRGKELKEYFDKEERFQIKDVVRIMSQILDALDYSHNRGVVHRDIKPANIILTEDGQVKVADFGIAKIESSNLTQAGTVLGTPTHMSPEQFMGHSVDRRSDIYSAGVILYQFLTGERPFTGSSVMAIMHKVINQEHIPPSALNFSLPKAFDAVIGKAMAKRLEDRYQTAREFMEDLKAAAENASIAKTGDTGKRTVDTDATLPLGATNRPLNAGHSQADIEAWKNIKNSQNLVDFHRYLKEYPNGEFAELAKLRMAELGKALREAEAKQAATKAPAISTRSTIATVLYFDVVGYTKQPVSKQIELKSQFNKLVSEFIRDIEEDQRIILDTGDGAAIGFMQHPEYAIEVAMQFRKAVTDNGHRDYPELNVRIGIHLGAVNIVKDMNGQNKMVGDGISDAQITMGFAPSDRIYVSRSYYEVVSRLTAEYAKLFMNRGMQKDKQGREHQMYEVVDDQQQQAVENPLDQLVQQMSKPPAGQQQANPSGIQLEPFAMSGSSENVTHKALVEAEAAEAKAAALLRAQQAAEALRIKAEQEAARLKEEEAARRMAEEQVKREWAEAEQRAKFQPQATMTRRPAKGNVEKPFPLGRLLASLFAMLVAGVAWIPYLFPVQDYVPQLEVKLSNQLQRPVHIGRLHIGLLPKPKLELQDVSVNIAAVDRVEMKAGNVTLNFDLATLLDENKVINSVVIDDLEIEAGALDKAMFWLLKVHGDAQYPVAHIVLRHGKINGEGLNLPGINGEAVLDAQGHFIRALLSSEDNRFSAELSPLLSRWKVALNIKDGRLPMLPDVLFDNLDVKGEISAEDANFNEISGLLYGGPLTGVASLSWKNGWQMQGRVNVKTMDLHRALPNVAVTGEADGDVSFTLSGNTLLQLGNAPHLEGAFLVKNGVINNVDMAEIANSPSLEGARGSITHFDELSGALLVDNNRQHLRQIKMSAGDMNAIGFVDVAPGGQVSGQLSVDMATRAGRGLPLSLSGKLADPVWRVTH